MILIVDASKGWREEKRKKREIEVDISDHDFYFPAINTCFSLIAVY